MSPYDRIGFDRRPIADLPNFRDPNLEGYRPEYSEARNFQVREIRGTIFSKSPKFGEHKFTVRQIRDM
jgi:hypothetical protein